MAVKKPTPKQVIPRLHVTITVKADPFKVVLWTLGLTLLVSGWLGLAHWYFS